MAARAFGLTGSLTGAEVGCSAVRRFKYLENFLHWTETDISNFGLHGRLLKKVRKGRWSNWTIMLLKISLERTLVQNLPQQDKVWQTQKDWRGAVKVAPLVFVKVAPPAGNY